MKFSDKKTVLIITGPTAVGKSAVAIRIAKYFDTEIISADSRQCYRELNIGVARPSRSELNEVIHHFIASHSIQEEVTVAGFEQYALQKAAALFQQHDTIVMVGGTGLYVKAFCEGLDEIPPVKPGVRSTINVNYKERGLAWLQQEVQQKDPAFYKAGEIKNPQRMMRALEVLESTGRSILSFHKGEKAKRNFTIIGAGLELPRQELNRNINSRVDQMMENGLLDEVRSLLPNKNMNALQTVGYTELFEFLDGKIVLEKAIEQIRSNTRKYAKRQLTWFRKDKSLQWFRPDQVEEIIQLVTRSADPA